MTYHVFKDRHSEWRWHLRSRNGRLVAASGEGYKRKGHCLKMINKIATQGYATITFETPRNVH